MIVTPSAVRRFDREIEDHFIDEELEEWLTCPECGSGEVGFTLWGDGVDMDLGCSNCGVSYGVR